MKTVLKTAQYLFVLVLPFALFFWLSPFTGDLTIGNDYPMFHIDQQMELQYSIARGSFPLYVPGFAGGHSTAALTLGQLFHPQSHLATLYPGYWEGKALAANTFWRLVALGLAHLVLFILLNRMGLRPEISFIISFITVYNLRMLDMFRYGASLENYLGYLFLCASMLFYYLKPSRVVGPVAVILSTYLLICGGHPQMMYLGLVGSGIICLLVPYSLAAIGRDVTVDRKRALIFYAKMAAFFAIGILLASVYTMPFYFEFIAENASRVGRGYKWSLAYGDSVGGSLNSFFKPLHSVVMNTFGSSSLIVLALFLPLVYAVRRRIPKVILIVLAAFAFVFLCGLGKYTPVHFVFWKFFPLANVFRIPGRIYLILPFIFLILLAWLLKNTTDDHRHARWLARIPSRVWIIVFSLGIYAWYNLHLIRFMPEPTHYIPGRIKEYPVGVDTFIFWTGFATLALLAAHAFLKRWWRTAVGILICISVIAQCGVALRYGTWIVKKRNKPTLEVKDRQKRSALDYKAFPGYGMESPLIAEQIKESILDPALARFYRKVHRVGSDKAAYRFLANERKPDEAVVVAKGKSKRKARCDTAGKPCPPDRVDLTYSAFNRLVFAVQSAEDGLFTLSYPYSKRWRATVDTKPASVHRTNGYLIGVPLAGGRHQVELRYWSAPAALGTALSGLTLLGLVGFFAFRYTRRYRIRIPIFAGSLLIIGGAYAAWYHSLYSGDNLKTRYTWTSKKFADGDNIAFGKKARMSSTKSLERPYAFYAGLAVDGNRYNNGFATGLNKPRPWWEVDLGEEKALKEMVIYGATLSKVKAHLPLQLRVSNQRSGFRTVQELSTPPKGGPWRVDLKGEKARFVRIQSSGKGSLSFKEVEIYEAD